MSASFHVMVLTPMIAIQAHPGSYTPTKTLYALYRWRDAYTITLAGQCGDAKFEYLHPEVEQLEEYAAASWEEAVAHLEARRDTYWIYNDGENSYVDGEDEEE